MTKTELRRAAYEATLQAAIEAAPPIGPAERDRLSRIWRASGSQLSFGEAGHRRAA